MNNHKNSRTTVHIREIIVKRVTHENVCPADVARAIGISVRTVHKWLRRHRDEGSAGLENRSSAATTLRHKLPTEWEEVIMYLRRSFRMTACCIAERLKLARSTVAAVLNRHRMGKLKYLTPKEPVRRFERATPGDLLHLDIKKLAKFDRPGHRITGNRRVNSRGARWEWVHVCVDDHSRLAYVEVLQDEKGETAAAFMQRATKYFQKMGIPVNEVMTDNGPCYRSRDFKKTCELHDLRHIRTRPYRPQTNGKAERFIKTLIQEWAYGREYQTSDERKGDLPRWVSHYNEDRKHGSLGKRPPITRIWAWFSEQRS